MVEFCGWEMPVQFQGVLEEHLAVRSRAGLFDVSNMGEIEVRGPKSLDAVQHLTCNDARLSPGQAQYTALTNERGGFVDDVIVYRRAEDLFLICVNAVNERKAFQWVSSRMPPGAEAINRSAEYAQIALQGPDALGILRGLTDAEVDSLRRFTFAEGEVASVPSIISRTGYTGEDGFELYCPAAGAADLWETILAAGAPFGLIRCGLAARDTLRVEACLLLYGNDIDETTTVLEAGLGYMVKLDKGEFIGRDALARQKESGVKRRLRAFEMVGRGIPRHGYPVLVEGEEYGRVTSGTFGPTVKKSIGLTYLPASLRPEEGEFDVVIRGKPTRARVVRSPFFQRRRTE